MCGIAGLLGPVNEELLERMGAVLAHRGPDDRGLWTDPAAEVGLVHRRLSIIDLSAGGHQPLEDAGGQAVIVYNGELYNYRELRRELERDGVRFRGESDTEVLLNVYLRDGEAMLTKLDGIFAFAIWDRRRGELFLARDPYGVKPLYYAETGQRFLFASELKALLQDAAVSRELCPDAVRDHVAYLYTPSPRSILRQVLRLQPGEALVSREKRVVRRWQYHEPPVAGAAEEEADPDALAAALRERFDAAVRRQLVADVPVGAFLSGGVDSSAIAEVARRSIGARRLQCFTIDLSAAGEAWEGFPNDLPYARQAAADLDVDLHAVRVGPEMLEELPAMLWHLDEPQADPAALHVLFISRLAREHGIKVLLSGTGGDDLFSGYRRHLALLQEGWWDWLPASLRGGLRRLGERAPARRPWGRRLQRLWAFADADRQTRLLGYHLWLAPARLAELFRPEVRGAWRDEDPLAPLRRTLQALPPALPRLEQMLCLERRHFLADHNLEYTDRMSMAAGVEVRVPFLDPQLVRFAAGVPPRYKQRGTEGKWLLKRALEGRLPRRILRRAKTGFGVPLRTWLRGPLASTVEETLSPRAVEARGLLDPAAVRRLRADDEAGRLDASYPLFSLVCLELWCRRYIDPEVPTP
jgi:asparagine synthase (glutamine-hydrolysing)